MAGAAMRPILPASTVLLALCACSTPVPSVESVEIRHMFVAIFSREGADVEARGEEVADLAVEHGAVGRPEIEIVALEPTLPLGIMCPVFLDLATGEHFCEIADVWSCKPEAILIKFTAANPTAQTVKIAGFYRQRGTDGLIEKDTPIRTLSGEGFRCGDQPGSFILESGHRMEFRACVGYPFEPGEDWLREAELEFEFTPVEQEQ